MEGNGEGIQMVPKSCQSNVAHQHLTFSPQTVEWTWTFVETMVGVSWLPVMENPINFDLTLLISF